MISIECYVFFAEWEKRAVRIYTRINDATANFVANEKDILNERIFLNFYVYVFLRDVISQSSVRYVTYSFLAGIHRQALYDISTAEPSNQKILHRDR